MNLSFDAIAEKAINETCPSFSAAQPVEDPLQKLVEAQAQQACLAWLIEARPYNTEAVRTISPGNYPGGLSVDAVSGFASKKIRGESIVFYASTHENITSDFPIHAVVKQPYNFSISGYTGDDIGSAREGAGVIELLNACGELDDITRYAWEGADIIIKAGLSCWRAEDFISVYEGVVQSIRWTETLLTLNLKDRATRLKHQLVRNHYAGTGQLEGTSTLANKPKPLVFGLVQNITPILVDPSALVYQVHDGPIDTVSLVRDGGVELTHAGDVTDVYTAAIPFGSYVTDLEKGIFRLGAQPIYNITADIRGSAPYIASTVDIIRRVLESYSFYRVNINENNAALANAVFPYQIGVYFNNHITVAAFLDMVCQAAYGYWSLNRTGELELHFIRQPQCQHVISLTEQDIIRYRHVNSPNILYLQEVAYARNWSPEQISNLAASLSNEALSFLAQDYKIIAREDGFTRQSYPGSQAETFKTLLQLQVDADFLANELLALRSKRRVIYEVVVPLSLFRFHLGDEIHLNIARYTLSSRCFIITGIQENASTLTSTLTLLG